MRREDDGVIISAMEDEPTPSATLPPKSSRMKLKQALTGLLVLLIVAGAAGGVWYWQQQKIDKLENAGRTTTTTAGDSGDSGLIDPTDTAHWNTVFLGPALIDDGSGAAGVLAGLSFRLPIGWTVKNCGGAGALVGYVSPTSDNQASCNSEGSSPIVVSVQAGDAKEAYTYEDTTAYTDREVKDVTIDGRAFQRISVTVAQPLEFGPAKGSKLVSYVALVDGVTYAATYVRNANEADKDLTTDFDKLVTETLKITTQ